MSGEVLVSIPQNPMPPAVSRATSPRATGCGCASRAGAPPPAGSRARSCSRRGAASTSRSTTRRSAISRARGFRRPRLRLARPGRIEPGRGTRARGTSPASTNSRPTSGPSSSRWRCPIARRPISASRIPWAGSPCSTPRRGSHMARAHRAQRAVSSACRAPTARPTSRGSRRGSRDARARPRLRARRHGHARRLVAFAGNPVTSDPLRYARSSATIEARPALGLGGTDLRLARRMFRAQAEVVTPEFGLRVAIPS